MDFKKSDNYLDTHRDPPKPVLDSNGDAKFSPYHSWIGLSHEMGHASLYIEGKQHPHSGGSILTTIPPGEIQAIDIENQIRYEHKDEGIMKKFGPWKEFWKLVEGDNKRSKGTMNK